MTELINIYGQPGCHIMPEICMTANPHFQHYVDMKTGARIVRASHATSNQVLG